MAGAVCDVCYKPGKGTVIGAAQVRDAVLNHGFNPFARNLVPGAPKDSAYFEKWKTSVVRVDVSDWNLCQRCYGEIRPFFSGAPAPAGVEEAFIPNTGDSMVDDALGPLAAAISTSRQADKDHRAQETKESKCFIATAACGSADAAEVYALQRWRDRTLLKSRAGMLFVRAYYRFSPPLAHWIEQRPRAQRLVRSLLVRPAARWARRR